MDNRQSSPRFNLGDIAGTLALIAAVEETENRAASLFVDLGWSRFKCASLVLDDSILEHAVHDCFRVESLDPLRRYELSS